MIPFKTRFTVEARPRLNCTEEERRTKSEFAADCDINLIMARYRKTGVLPESSKAAAARYGDFSSVPTFMEMQEKIIAANELFAALPAAVRKQFDNDPGAFLAASESSEGRALMAKLGLGKEQEAPTPSATSPTPPRGSARASVEAASAPDEAEDAPPPAPAPSKAVKK